MFSFVEISTSNAFFGVNVREVANSENNHPLNVSRPRCVLSPLCVRLPYSCFNTEVTILIGIPEALFFGGAVP